MLKMLYEKKHMLSDFLFHISIVRRII